MTKKVFTIIICFVCLTKLSAQIEVHSSNQVGIGTTNLQYKLHVVGDTYTTGNLFLGGYSSRLGIGTTTPQYNLHVEGDALVSGTMYLGNAANFLQSNYPNLSKVNNILQNVYALDVSFGYETLLNPYGNQNTAVGYKALRSSHTRTALFAQLWMESTQSLSAEIEQN